MALGVPVVAYDWGPLPELSGALHVPTGDHRALLSATLAVLREESLRGRVDRRNSATTVAGRHDAKLAARAYERLYLELLHEPT